MLNPNYQNVQRRSGGRHNSECLQPSVKDSRGSVRVWGWSSFIFQHENDPSKHTSNTVKAYLDRKTHNGTLSVIDWCPQSPDLKIIEVVWDHLNREHNKRQPIPKEKFFCLVQEEESLFNHHGITTTIFFRFPRKI